MRSRRKINPSSIEVKTWPCGPEVHISISTPTTIPWARRKDVESLAMQLRNSGACREVSEVLETKKDRRVLIRAVIRNDGRRAKNLSIIRRRIRSSCLLMTPGKNEPTVQEHQEETCRRSRRDYAPARRAARVRRR